MKNQIDPNAIPGVGSVETSIKTEKVELKNVLFGKDGCEDVTVEVVPFNRRNDDHVDFAYAYSDMLFRAPSSFANVSDASRAYARLFVVHKKEDENDPDSVYRKVTGDLRACRTLFHQEKIVKDLNDFFEGV